MQSDNRDLLVDGLGRLGLRLDERRLAALVAYHDLLLQTCADGLNLTGIRDERESVVANLLDSLAPLSLLDLPAEAPRDQRGGLTLAEVGAGGGLPGLPLAVVLPPSVVEVALIESKEKKCVFLRAAAAAMQPSIAPRRIEVRREDAMTTPYQYDRLVFRAFGPLATIVRLSDRLLAPGGMAVAWKGRRARIDEELAALPEGRREAIRIVPVTVPHLAADERHAVIIR
ncbi:MAG: 16S rRNA (guanine(527)-N(7))-methyltransferase RsmG [Planctomycetota bacterium]